MMTMPLTEKEYKVLTWMDDVTGMTNKVVGDNLVIFYKAMPSYWNMTISLEEVALTIEDIRIAS